VKYYLLILFLIPSFSWSQQKPSAKTKSKPALETSKKRNPTTDHGSYQVIPLDPQTEKLIQATNLEQYLSEFDGDQKEFHRKAYNSYKKITPVISLKNTDPLYFIYDCIFMYEDGFFMKYSSLPKDSLTKARKIVTEEFSP